MSFLDKDNDMTCLCQCQCPSIFKLSKILTVCEKKITVNVYFWHFFGIFFWENKLIRENLIRTLRYKNSWFFSRRELLSRFEIIMIIITFRLSYIDLCLVTLNVIILHVLIHERLYTRVYYYLLVAFNNSNLQRINWQSFS